MTTARKQESPDDWMSIGAAAGALGETRLATLTRAIKGEVVAKHLGGRTFVRRDTVDALLATRTETAGRVA